VIGNPPKRKHSGPDDYRTNTFLNTMADRAVDGPKEEKKVTLLTPQRIDSTKEGAA